MAVEGEWAWPRCIGCGKRIEKKRPRDFRYGMDVCCAHCLRGVLSTDNYKVGWSIEAAESRLKRYRKSEEHDQPVQERLWQMLATDYALAWARLRDHFQMPEFPAGLELFLVEILNVRDQSGRR